MKLTELLYDTNLTDGKQSLLLPRLNSRGLSQSGFQGSDCEQLKCLKSLSAKGLKNKMCLPYH
jgi:hypothetical protein